MLLNTLFIYRKPRMLHNQMEQPEVCRPLIQSDHIQKVTEIISQKMTNKLHFYMVKVRLSPQEVKNEDAHKLYQQMNLSMYRIIQEIDHRKVIVDFS